MTEALAATLELLAHLESEAEAQDQNLLAYYKPYPKQMEFHAAGAHFSERLLSAANQSGKTFAGAAEISFHMTGDYPDGWPGLRFSRAPVIWVGGESAKEIRGTTQRLLLGRIEDSGGLGTGAIPRDSIIDIVRAVGGIRDTIDYARVRHSTGGVSLVYFMSYEQRREKWQGETIDLVWFDEEPDPDIYSEGRTRTNNGQVGPCTMMTYTPMKGMTKISKSFHMDRSKYQSLTVMTLEDVGHYSEEQRQQIEDRLDEFEFKARAQGLPMIGEGMVFPILEEAIKIPPFEIPLHFARIMGGDFGWDHPQAWVNIAWDRDQDILYVTNEYRVSKTSPDVASLSLRHWEVDGWKPPVAWPHDGLQHDKGSGLQLAGQYRMAGLNMLHEHATHEEGGFGVEAGIQEMLDRMREGRLKVFSTCPLFFEEMRSYHRMKGLIVKLDDDVICAVRYAMMMRRFAQVPEDLDEPFYERMQTNREVGVSGY